MSWRSPRRLRKWIRQWQRLMSSLKKGAPCCTKKSSSSYRRWATVQTDAAHHRSALEIGPHGRVPRPHATDDRPASNCVDDHPASNCVAEVRAGTCLVCGNVYHNGFRFQLRLKLNEAHPVCYLCLRAWLEVSDNIRATEHFTLTLISSPAVLHSRKHLFQATHNGWSWRRFVSFKKPSECTNVQFIIEFHELSYDFVMGDRAQSRKSDAADQRDRAECWRLYTSGDCASVC